MMLGPDFGVFLRSLVYTFPVAVAIFFLAFTLSCFIWRARRVKWWHMLAAATLQLAAYYGVSQVFGVAMVFTPRAAMSAVLAAYLTALIGLPTYIAARVLATGGVRALGITITEWLITVPATLAAWWGVLLLMRRYNL